MRRFLKMLLAGIVLLSACNAATGITIKAPWARPAAQGDNGAVYFLLQNHSAWDDELIGVSSDIATAVEIHESKMDGDVMQMQQVMSLPIEGKASIEFAPGGFHVMLIGLKQDLNVGDSFQLTLEFRDYEDITVSIPVHETGSSESISDH